MHFWIDKRSQCGGYSSRQRVPSSLSAGVGRPRGRVSVGVPSRKSMVTPVHRFQAVECAVGAPRRPPVSTQQSSQHCSTGQLRQTVQYHGLASSYPAATQQGLISNFGIPATNASQPATAATRRTAEFEGTVFLDIPLDNSSSSSSQQAVPMIPPFPHVPLMPSHVKCGMWASFALATVFVAGAKFYFDHQLARSLQGTGLEVLVLCALLIVVLLGACAVSMCKSRESQPMPQPIRVSSTGVHDPDAVNTRSTNDDLLQTLLSLRSRTLAARDGQPLESEPPPPPYHIAVLLPQRTDEERRIAHAQHRADQPPPTYEKAVS